jgi:hypothetical protein
MSSRKVWRYVYTPKTARQRKIIIRMLFVLSLPIIAPLYVLYYVGQLADWSLDLLEDVGEKVAEFIVFKILPRWSK